MPESIYTIHSAPAQAFRCGYDCGADPSRAHDLDLPSMFGASWGEGYRAARRGLEIEAAWQSYENHTTE